MEYKERKEKKDDGESEERIGKDCKQESRGKKRKAGLMKNVERNK